jgi:uncharacterized protein (DUF302 family)
MTAIRQITLVLTFLIVSGPVWALDDLVVKRSSHPVGVTLDRLSSLLTQKGITIMARINHAAGAAKVGRQMAPTELLIFGNPALGTPLMETNPKIGLALPMKVLAWQDGSGTSWIAYRAPSDLMKAYGITGRDKIFSKMAKALNALTSKAAAVEQ